MKRPDLSNALMSGCEGNTVVHALDGHGFDHIVAGVRAPGATQMSMQLFLRLRASGNAMNIDPLFEGFFHILRIDDGVGAAMPQRDLRPWSGMRRRGSNHIPPLLTRTLPGLRHRLQRFLNVD